MATSKITHGEVIEKEFDPAYESSIFHYNYAADTILTDGPEKEQHYNQWRVKIEGKKFGKKVTVQYAVSKKDFDKIEIGSQFDAKAVANSRLIQD